MPGLEEHYLSNQFLKRVHRMLPEELGSQFLMKLQENGESYYLMKGKQYMDRMISLLRCFYKSLEIALEDYSPQQAAPVVATTTPRLVRPPGARDGSMSVNMFNMDMCPAPCATPSAASVPHSPKKRRRKRRRSNRINAFTGIEERVAKLEEELKQVRLQLARQERRKAELETRTKRPEGNDRATRMFEQDLLGPDSMNKTNSTHRTAVGRKGVGPEDGSDGSKSGDFDQKNRAQVSRTGQVERKRRSRKRKRRSKNAQEGRTGSHTPALADNRPGEPSSVSFDHRGLPSGRAGNESGKPFPGTGCTTLTSRGNSVVTPSAAVVRESVPGTGVGIAARGRKYAVLYAQKTPLNRAPQVARVDPMALLQFALVIEMWKTRLIPVLIWIMQHLKN